MKKFTQTFYALAVMSLMLTSCGKQHFSISGSIHDSQFDGRYVYLLHGVDVVDSALVDNGTFAFDGKVSQPWLASLSATGESVRATANCIVEPGVISVDMLDASVKGTPMNDSLQAFAAVDDYYDIEADMRSYEQLYYTTPSAEVRAQAEHLYDSLEAIGTARTFERAKALFLNNKTNPMGEYAMTVMVSTNCMNYADMQALLDGASDAITSNPSVQNRLSQLLALDQTSVGKHYTDIQGVDGKLSDLIDGRLALVDFYASWCPPCRAEIKDNLVPLWAKYQDKGLIIVGLNVWERGSLEKRTAAHQKVMADLGITYPQLVDSTTVATDTYGVRGIPQIMLIAPDGTILARDLRGSAIEEAILNALGK